MGQENWHRSSEISTPQNPDAKSRHLSRKLLQMSTCSYNYQRENWIQLNQLLSAQEGCQINELQMSHDRAKILLES